MDILGGAPHGEEELCRRAKTGGSDYRKNGVPVKVVGPELLKTWEQIHLLTERGPHCGVDSSVCRRADVAPAAALQIDPELADHVAAVREVLESGEPIITKALVSNLAAFRHAVRALKDQKRALETTPHKRRASG